jgi:predicted metal-dependent phosphoesterase TrpH
MIKLDLHIHSQYSEDGSGTAQDIIKILKKKGLQGMAITDHNSIEGSLNALKFATKDFLIIPGVEISTNKGHVIALNIKEDIEKNLPLEETIEKIQHLGGIPIVAHVFRTMSGINLENLKKIHSKLSAIEVFNSCSDFGTNLKTAKIAKKFNLGGVGGSDSHIPEHVGSGYTIINTTDYNVDTVLSEINNKKTWGEGDVLPLDYRSDRMIKSVRQFLERGFKRI